MQQSDGPWFDSGWPDFILIFGHFETTIFIRWKAFRSHSSVKTVSAPEITMTEEAIAHAEVRCLPIENNSCRVWSSSRWHWQRMPHKPFQILYTLLRLACSVARQVSQLALPISDTLSAWKGASICIHHDSRHVALLSCTTGNSRPKIEWLCLDNSTFLGHAHFSLVHSCIQWYLAAVVAGYFSWLSFVCIKTCKVDIIDHARALGGGYFSCLGGAILWVGISWR